MNSAPTDRGETLRLAALASYRILESVTEPEFDMLSRLIATICETPISLISLVDAERQWCKSTHGVEDCGTSREFSFCARAIECPTETYVVPDTLADPTFVHNPLVTGDPFVRFYAGVPLVTHDGFAVGTLCVIDRTPRVLSPAQYRALASAASVVMTLVEQRVAIDTHHIVLKRAGLLRTVADHASDAIVILETHRDGAIRVSYANAAYAALTGIAVDDVVDSDLDALPSRATPTIAATWCRAAIASGVPISNEIPLLRADGTSITTEMCIGPGEPIDFNGSQHWLLVIRDISALRRRDEARHARNHDLTTGLLNEAGLIAKIDTPNERERYLAVACFAIERLDDAALAMHSSLPNAIARRLLAIVDEAHAIARTGEWEFAVYMTAASVATIDTTVATYARDLGVPYRVGNVDAIVMASVGIAHADDASATASDLVRRARERLGVAVGASRSRPRVTRASTRDDATIDAAILGDALRANAFELAYQPIVALESSREVLVGFEALFRWPIGARNGWSPLDTILAAERTGFIETLGSWILDRACAQLATWQHDYASSWSAKRLSVNVSPKQLESIGFEQDVRSALARHRGDPSGLTLELTETAAMRDPDAIRTILLKLRDDGIAFDLDDFGTGYSSLSRLHTLPIDRLKIDREFVSGAGDGLANERIVETILSLAEGLGMGLVAEGVETAAQRARLYRMGCRNAQGYLFGRPLPAAEATALLDKKERPARADLSPNSAGTISSS